MTRPHGLPAVHNEKPSADIDKAIKVTEGLRYAQLKKVDDNIGALKKRIKGAAEGIKVCDTVLAGLK